MSDALFPDRSRFPASRNPRVTRPSTPGNGQMPLPPPVYRPQQTTGVSQPKGASAPAPHKTGAPPVYRPQPPRVAQARKAPAANALTAGKAPPVYRPQPAPLQMKPAARPKMQTPRAPHLPALQAKLQARMTGSVIQRTVWEWDDTKKYWSAVRSEGPPTARPVGPGAYTGDRISTGVEDPWAVPVPVVAVVAPVDHRDATWKRLTRLPLYALAFGEVINPDGCHSEEEILAQLTGKRSKLQDGDITKLWAGRAKKVASDKALVLELNAWPCRGDGDPNCHAKLSHFASTNGVTITVNVVGDSGGYESGHKSDPHWVDGADKITYTGAAVTYSK